MTAPSAGQPASARRAPPTAPSSPPPKSISRQALTLTTGRSSALRDRYRLMLSIATIQGVIIVALIGVITSIIVVRDPPDRYFATTSDGRVIQLDQLDAARLAGIFQARAERAAAPVPEAGP